MHEMAFCESLMAVIEDQVLTGNYHHVNSVSLEVGALAGVEPEALQFGFQAVSHGTVADGAELKILPRTALAHCPLCLWQDTVADLVGFCPKCGGPLQMYGGHELRIKEMEVE